MLRLLGMRLLQLGCVIVGCGNQALVVFVRVESLAVCHIVTEEGVDSVCWNPPLPVVLSAPILSCLCTQHRCCTLAMVTGFEL